MSESEGVSLARRVEHDSLGELEIADSLYYGIQTRRALENFPFSSAPLSRYPEFVRALAATKKAAARANRDAGLLSRDVAEAIGGACDDILAGRLHDQFAVDLIQGGAGTSTNMNANEVIANRALERLGHPRGSYAVIHPNNHVNLSQSTNDVYPSALKMALRSMLVHLIREIQTLAEAWNDKAAALQGVIKMGRTEMQDAVPMTLGQAFAAYRTTLLEEVDRLAESRALLLELNLGGTAIGTGIATRADYRSRVIGHLGEITGEPYRSATDLVEATQDTGVFMHLSGALRRTAMKLSKICSDLRLLSSGPRAGLGEINLPPLQPGSSIMPGKVNPVIPEAVNEIAFMVAGNDVAITLAASAGQLELNAFEPLIALKLFESVDLLTRACAVLTEKCVKGITANVETCRRHVATSIGLVTALLPQLGYERCTQVAQEAQQTGASVSEIVLRRGWLTASQLDEAMDPRRMLAPATS